MSDDSYILVDKSEDRFRVSMQFASEEEPHFTDRNQTFDSLGDALDEAYEWEVREVVVEYGIVIDPRCFDEDDTFGIDDRQLCSDHPTEFLVDGCKQCEPEGQEFLMDCGA